MTTVIIPPPLQKHTGGRDTIAVEAGSLGSVLEQLGATFPDLRSAVLSERGEVRRFVSIFVDQKNAKHQAGMDTPVRADSVVRILLALAGG